MSSGVALGSSLHRAWASALSRPVAGSAAASTAPHASVRPQACCSRLQRPGGSSRAGVLPPLAAAHVAPAAVHSGWSAPAGPRTCSRGRRGRLSGPAAAADGAQSGWSQGWDWQPYIQALQRFAQAQFLPLALLSALTLGYTFPQLGLVAADWNIPLFSTTGIFILQGLNLKRGEAVKALKATGAVSYGLTSILLLTPLLGFAAIQLPLAPRELAVGLAVFCCMPTALSSGVTFTQAVGGNVALALLLTLCSNMIGIFTIPFILPAVLGAEAGAVALSPWPLLQQLVQCILVPIIAGACCRAFIPGVAGWVDGHKQQLAYLGALFLALVPWVQVSKAVAQQAPLSAYHLLMAALCGISIHLVFLALNTAACRLLQIGGSDLVTATPVRRALILTASVKTLPVAVTVLSKLGPLLGGMVGVAVVPCVLAHLSQIIIDSVMVSHWKSRDAQKRRAAMQ